MQRNRIQVAHEAPFVLMPLMRKYTDYDYALVHLFEDPDKDFAKKYYDFFATSLQRGRRVILDNSVFELGESYGLERFFEWVYKLQPTEYIIPDVLNNMEETLLRVHDWFQLVKEKEREGKVLNSKSIAVCQGEEFINLFQCYQRLCDMGVDKIAISFDCSCYLKVAELFEIKCKEEGYMIGRQLFVRGLAESILEGELPKKPFHLLGCALPQEFSEYSNPELYSFIETLDTSNPVVHGLKEIKYSDEGLKRKDMTKLVNFMKLKSSEIKESQRDTIYFNVKKFKKLLK